MGVEFGIYVNNRAAVFLGPDYSLDRLLEAAVRAEEYGFSFVSVGDSILAKPRYRSCATLPPVPTRSD
jgi:alkanesulfonate monooxygenase SsuD/methylene tetrahydromethanopterin reductase-like flavin-dependent oxidoreductase (luciferase family)